MNNINFRRVLLGGLLAGFILNVGEVLLNEVIFVKQMEEMARQHSIARPGVIFIATAVTLTFLLGILIVLVYAMIRPRVGAGPKAAILAGLVGWFCIYFYAAILNGLLFGLAPGLLGIGIIWGLAEYIFAALAGAALYKEN